MEDEIPNAFRCIIPNTFHFVIPNADRTSILVRRFGQNLSLPKISPSKTEDSPRVNYWNAETDDLCSVIAAGMGIDAYVLRPLWMNRDAPPLSGEDVLLVLEPRDYTFGLPNGLEWLERAAVLEGRWESPHRDLDMVQLLSTFFEEAVDGKVPKNRAPWRRNGWFRDIETWTLEVLKENGMEVVERLEQLRNMYYSSVLRCRVEKVGIEAGLGHSENKRESIYVKTTLPITPEARMTATISLAIKGLVPRVLSFDENRHSMIQLGAYGLDETQFEPSALMKMLGEIQIGSLKHIKALKSGGLPDRGLAWLHSEIPVLLRNPILDLCGSCEQLQSLRMSTSELQRVCEKLADYRIPKTLVHGDFNLENVLEGVESGRKYSVIDWASCCIGHPLYDYLRIAEIGCEIQDDVPKESYLELWNEFEVPENVREAVQLAYPLFLLYNLHILLHLYEVTEPVERPLMTRAIRSRPKLILRALDQIRECFSSESSEELSPNTYHFIIPSADGGRVLIHRSGQNMSIPKMSPPKTETSTIIDNWDKDPDRIRAVVASEIGIDAYVLRPVWIRPDTRHGIEEVVLVLAPLDYKFDLQDGLEWIDRETVLKTRWEAIHEDVDLTELLSRFFDETVDGKVPRNRAPWRLDGWFRETTDWIASALKKHNMELVTPINQIRNTFQSSVMTCRVRRANEMKGAISSSEEEEVLYVKTTLPDAPDAKLSAMISSLCKGVAPEVIEVDEGRNTLIQLNVGIFDETTFDLGLLMKTLAETQIRSFEQVDALKEAGLKFFGLEWLRSRVGTMLADPILDLCRQNRILTELRAQIGKIECYCLELSSFRLPEVLVHADFHVGNVGRKIDETWYHIFDWSAAYIGHPFYDFSMMVNMTEEITIDQEVAENVYFSFWKKYGSVGELKRASELAFALYWCLNLHLLLEYYAKVESVEHLYIMREVDFSLHTLAGAVRRISEGKAPGRTRKRNDE